jgi:hypothetical protein
MPPIVDAGLSPRQAFGSRSENEGSLAAKVRPSGFWAPGANSIFNSNIRLFWHVPFADCAAKQAVAVAGVPIFRHFWNLYASGCRGLAQYSNDDSFAYERER